MNYYSKDLLTSLLQFFGMDADAQLAYAKTIPADLNDNNFDFGLDQSPLLEMAEGTENISRVLASVEKNTPEAIQSLEELHAVLQLIVCCNGLADFGTAKSLRNNIEWRLVRKLARICLGELGIPRSVPTIAYEELVPHIMD